ASNAAQSGTRFTYNPLTNTFSSLGAIANNTTDAYAAVLFDVDDDGDLDLFQGNSAVADRLYTNDGSGNFTAGTTFDTASSEPSGVEVGDLNGDGFADVLV
ncbi:MAG TPA: VCBS repeat-containing protein, partial [Myxococcota bacterium]|nr:VCBS repeat-containing protein [Myxococcota bacterium]